MSEVQGEVPLDHPMRAAWEAYKQTEDYRNTLRWAAAPIDPENVVGSLWAAFVKGWEAREAVAPSDDSNA